MENCFVAPTVRLDGLGIEMKPFREQINEIRSQNPDMNPKNKGKGSNSKSKQLAVPAKRRIQELEKSNEQLKRHLSSLQSTNDKIKSEEKVETTALVVRDNSGVSAGDAFGGKGSMKKGPT